MDSKYGPSVLPCYTVADAQWHHLPMFCIEFSPLRDLNRYRSSLATLLSLGGMTRREHCANAYPDVGIVGKRTVYDLLVASQTRGSMTQGTRVNSESGIHQVRVRLQSLRHTAQNRGTRANGQHSEILILLEGGWHIPVIPSVLSRMGRVTLDSVKCRV